MSKKKRKTRREKENIKSHSLIYTEALANGATSKTTTQLNSSIGPLKKNISADPLVIKDFRKVIIITSVVILFTLIMWVLVYQTNLFNFVFDKLNIKY